VIDKKVVTGDFRGIKKGMLVKLTQGSTFAKQGDIALVLETALVPRGLDEPSVFYDPMLVILNRNTKSRWPVEFAEVVPDEMTDEQY
jgi:hypothetical protein